MFLKQSNCAEKELVVLMEMTLENLLAEGQLNHADFLARVDILGALGRTVLISKFGEYYRLAGYLSRYTNRMIGLVMGVPSLMEIFDEKYYLNLEGGILEALGRMFKGGLKLFVYPMIDDKTGDIVTAKQLKVAPNLRALFHYLIDNRYIEEIVDYLPKVSADSSARGPGKTTVRRQFVGANGPARGRPNYQEAAIFLDIGRRYGLISSPSACFGGSYDLFATKRECRHDFRYSDSRTMAKRADSVIGIDLGKHVFKAVTIRRKSDSCLILTSFASRQVPEIFSQRRRFGSAN